MSKINLKQIFCSIIIINLFFYLPFVSHAEESSDMILASKLIDHEIYGKTGDQFGEIDDLVIKRSGKVKKVTIEVGGFLGIGDKLVAVSLKELQNLMVKGDGKIVLDTTEQQMEKRSEFDYYRQGLRPDYYYRPGHYRRYGYRAFPPPYYRSRPHGPQPPEQRIAPYPEGESYDEWAFSPARYLASSYIDRQVIGANGVYIGRVKDLLIDTQDAKVKKIILAVEDIRGDDSHVAIPYEAPGFTAYGIVCDISQKQIRNFSSYRYEN
jgi:sporulation protein YlmC with PRC-barrel domain